VPLKSRLWITQGHRKWQNLTGYNTTFYHSAVMTTALSYTIFELFHVKLEKHSVERIYLRQRSSDGSVNKTILKQWLTLAAHRQYVYEGFSRRQPRQGCKVL